MERLLKSKLKNGEFAGLTSGHSRRMAAVRGKRNKTTELALRMALVRNRITGWTLHAKLPGCPDFYFPRQQVSVFVDGCFWHGCPKCGHIPERNKEYWVTKLGRNHQRDIVTKTKLEEAGISVIRFWEHQLKDANACAVKLRTIISPGLTKPPNSESNKTLMHA